MRSTVTALAAAATIAIGAAAAPSTAQAYCYGCAVGAGVIGGLAAGAIIGSAIAAPPPYYAPAPVYPAYGPGPGCHYERQPVWDPQAGVWRRGPKVMVCP